MVAWAKGAGGDARVPKERVPKKCVGFYKDGCVGEGAGGDARVPRARVPKERVPKDVPRHGSEFPALSFDGTSGFGQHPSVPQPWKHSRQPPPASFE